MKSAKTKKQPHILGKRTTDAHRALGQRLRDARVALGVSQTTVGQALGVTCQQVQHYEYGRHRIDAIRLARAADYLRVPVAELLDGL